MIKVYIHGCLTCGTRRTACNNVRRYAEANSQEYVIIDTKASQQHIDEHMNYLMASDLPTDSYPAIVVNNGVVTPLIDWL